MKLFATDGCKRSRPRQLDGRANTGSIHHGFARTPNAEAPAANITAPIDGLEMKSSPAGRQSERKLMVTNELSPAADQAASKRNPRRVGAMAGWASGGERITISLPAMPEDRCDVIHMKVCVQSRPQRRPQRGLRAGGLIAATAGFAASTSQQASIEVDVKEIGSGEQVFDLRDRLERRKVSQDHSHLVRGDADAPV